MNDAAGEQGQVSGAGIRRPDLDEDTSSAPEPEPSEDGADRIRVTFASGSSQLTVDAILQLDEMIRGLDEGIGLTIEGHTDSWGESGANQRLSERRALAVVDYLAEAGVSPDRLTAVGYGETRPIADNENAAGRAINRRVEVVIGR